jgi:membrane protein
MRGSTIAGFNSDLHRSTEGYERSLKSLAARWPIRSLWDLQGIPLRTVALRTWKSLISDRVFGHAAELGFYFLFALFPTLFCASSILGLAARSADQIYDKLLDYLALVIPTSALGTILATFNETTAASTSGKLTFSLIAALWSASVGISAIQDTLNDVYKIKDTRSYFRARIYAIGLTILLTALISSGLGAMLAGNALAGYVHHRAHDRLFGVAIATAVRLAAGAVAAAVLSLSFAVLYYWAPDRKVRTWHWLTPGCTVGIAGWLAFSLGFRAYLHFFNTYPVIYGSLGAVIILLMWFYTTGLMLLTGAEINSEIEAAAAEKKLAASPMNHAGSGQAS